AGPSSILNVGQQVQPNAFDIARIAPEQEGRVVAENHRLLRFRSRKGFANPVEPLVCDNSYPKPPNASRVHRRNDLASNRLNLCDLHVSSTLIPPCEPRTWGSSPRSRAPGGFQTLNIESSPLQIVLDCSITFYI